MVTAKPCTKCGETKPLADFYPRRDGKLKYRSECKACGAKAAKQRRKNPSVMVQIMRHYADPTTPLTPEADAVINPTDPIDPKVVEQYQQRRRKREEAEARKLRRLKREAEQNPLSHAARCYARMLRE